MHVSTRRISFLGLLLAITVLLNVLSSIVESSTLFFLAGASFLVGISFRETNKRMGLGFYIASILLSFIIAPNKIYCITFGIISLYIVVIELLQGKILHRLLEKGKWNIYIIKYTVFNIIFIPLLIWFPELIIAKKMSTSLLLMFFAGGQIAFYVYDLAYGHFIIHYWNKYRKNLNL